MSDAAIPWCSRGIALLRIMVPQGKERSIPHGMMRTDTEAWAQYVYPTGAVATRTWPVRKQHIAANIMNATLTLERKNPTAREAQKPLAATGLCWATVDNRLWPRTY